MAEARRLATYEDLLDLPDDVVGEIVGGELYASPRPAPRHAIASSPLGAHLGAAFGRRRGGGPGGWIVDPLLRALEVYRLHGEHRVLVGTHTGDDPVRAEPFDAVKLDPTEWWGPEEPAPTRS